MMESTYNHTFLFGFPNNRSDILLHLTHWQYWFWYWFTFLLVLYYFIFLRLLRFRPMKFSPKMNTSFRSHGKWGDLLVCFLPISWCLNILSNSNFILRMIEWQSESTLFTLRVRGKQWYWIYKLELKVLTDATRVPRNIGDNYWLLNTNNNVDNFLFFVKYRHSLRARLLNWKKPLMLDNSFRNSFSNSSFFSTLDSEYKDQNFIAGLAHLQDENLTYNSAGWLTEEPYNINSGFFKTKNKSVFDKALWGYSMKLDLSALKMPGNKSSSSYPVNVTRYTKLSRQSFNQNFRLFFDGSRLGCKFNTIKGSTFKPYVENLFLVIKQKRFVTPIYLDGTTRLNDCFKYYKNNLKFFNISLHINKNIDNVINPSTNKRLLRTKRILVLPAFVNIGLITNSFDVMHSWYIPGLGVKLDCVPGRSTHHILHIDHVGFYYGQCAEICGRYHHHMPIRICALPFEHFVLWWHNYGTPFFMAKNKERASYRLLSSKLMNW